MTDWEHLPPVQDTTRPIDERQKEIRALTGKSSSSSVTGEFPASLPAVQISNWS